MYMCDVQAHYFFVLSNLSTACGDLHGRVYPATLQIGKKRQAYQGGVGRSPTIFFFLLIFYYIFEKMTRFYVKAFKKSRQKRKKTMYNSD